jgi:pimeloyl-ACP methyl ester carboxylesterase
LQRRIFLASQRRPEIGVRVENGHDDDDGSIQISNDTPMALGIAPCRRTMTRIQRLLLWLAVTILPMPAIGDTVAGFTGLQSDVVFSNYSPLSSSAELLHRFLSPLNALRAEKRLAHSAVALRDQPIDLARERFTVYVPSHSPAEGYGLLVFVPPWENAMLPRGWAAILDRHGVIFVSAANSGNAANILDRREPLALLAAHNIMQRFHVDPERTYIGGFSGGSRVALRLALEFPDVFRGAFLNAGSDPIGDAQAPLPTPELFSRFQEMTRIVYISGQNDAVNVEKDAASEQSLLEWCVFDWYAERSPWTGHEVAGPAVLGRALDMLDKHGVNMARLNNCRLRINQELDKTIVQANDLLAAGDADGARRSLNKIDTRYGGLAAPRSVDLAARIGMD